VSGEPNYHARILKGRLFRSMQLDGADFSGADVRGADFSNASLVGADFTNARIGVRPFTAFVILAVALVVSIAAGVAIGLLAETAREKATASDWRDVFGAVLLIATVLLFFGYLVVKGISQALRVFLRAVVIVIVVDFAIVFVLAGEVRFAHAFPIIILLVLLLPAATAGILGRIVGGTFGAWGIGFVAVIGGLAAGRTHGGAAAIVVSLLLVLISKRALKNDARDRPMRVVAHRIVTQRGTCFTGADLTRADFTGTALTHSDVSGAELEGAVWESGSAPLVLDNN
jgi:hypothetical protein